MEAVRVRTDQVKPGMIVAKDIYTGDQLIITKGTELNKKAIDRLRFYGVFGLYIINEQKKQHTELESSYINRLRNSEDFIKFNDTYKDSVDHVQKGLEECVRGEGELKVEQLLEETDRVLKEGRNGAHILEMLHGIRNYDDLTYVHSLNVSLICGVFAGWLNLSIEESRILTLGGLLHDIGKIMIPENIIKKPDKLTEEEFRLVKSHAEKGYNLIKDRNIDQRVKDCILMHHERCDGSGYPFGLKADKIEEFAKIISIADVYDAMTSNRQYRTAICPFKVIEMFEQEGLQKFDPGYLLLFMERIVLSYLHTEVRLSDGRIGEVVMTNRLSLSKPIVRIETDFVDLSKQRNIEIESII